MVSSNGGAGERTRMGSNEKKNQQKLNVEIRRLDERRCDFDGGMNNNSNNLL